MSICMSKVSRQSPILKFIPGPVLVYWMVVQCHGHDIFSVIAAIYLLIRDYC